MIDQIAISWLKSKHDSLPKRANVAWSQFITAFSFRKVRRADCSIATCKHHECPHKNGKSWSPAIYPAGSARKKQNVDCVSLLVIDVDHKTEEQLATFRERIASYQHLIHASHSDRPARVNTPCTCGSSAGALHGTACPSRVDRCVRAIITLSRPVKNAEWRRFWRATTQTFADIDPQLADPACCDSNRLYYLPSRPSDAEYFFETSDGVPLDVDTILAAAPPEEVSIAADLSFEAGGTVATGQRHAMLKSLAGALRFRGSGEQEILVALRNANQRCNPPKSDEELVRLAQWAAEQPESSLPPPPIQLDSESQPDGPVDEENEDFLRNHKGFIIDDSQDNVDLALRKLGVKLRYDEFANHEIVEGLAGFGPRLDDGAVNRLRFTIDAHFGFRPSKVFFYDVIADRSKLNRFHPVRSYLKTLTWDGISRIERWLIDYAGAKDTTYVRAVSRIVLVAAVRRIRHPGVKYDEMLILESEQGTEKSSGLRALSVNDDWFADDLPLHGDTKKFMEATSGKWIVEASELSGMKRSEVSSLKACLSRQIDESRLSYDRKPTIAARQFIVIGTTNEKDGYLRDPTGNRRFWPVRVEKIDLIKLRRDRDQLWAEAAHLEAQPGMSIRLDPALYEEAALEQDARVRNEDPLVDALNKNLGNVTGKLRIADAYLIAGIEPGKATQDQMHRFGAAIRELGWERERRRIAGERCYAYVRGNESQREVKLYVEQDFLTRGIKITTAHSQN